MEGYEDFDEDMDVDVMIDQDMEDFGLDVFDDDGFEGIFGDFEEGEDDDGEGEEGKVQGFKEEVLKKFSEVRCRKKEFKVFFMFVLVDDYVEMLVDE